MHGLGRICDEVDEELLELVFDTAYWFQAIA